MKTRISAICVIFLLLADLTAFAQQGVSITSLSPSTTQATTSAFQLTISGTGFDGNVQVSLGGMPCTVVASSATRIVANIPASANIEGNRELLLTRAGAVIVRAVYAIGAGAIRLPPPRISVAAQDRGTVIIRGENFVTGATVFVHILNGNTYRAVTVAILSLTAVQIVVQLPSGISSMMNPPDFTPLPTIFPVTVRNPDGQVASTFGGSQFVGVKQKEFVFIKVFPNPATENITIETSTNAPSQAVFILRNALGQELMRFTKALPSGQVSTTLDMHLFPAGTYFLEVQSGTERVVERLLKH
jgi:hypothetical protein